MDDSAPAGLARRRRRARRRTVRRLTALVVAATTAISVAVAYAAQPMSPSVPGTDGPLRIATTTTFVDDAVRRVGGEHVSTVRLMGPGVDPHLYQAKASDLRQMRRADAVVAVGLYLEASMTRTLRAISHTKPVLFVGEAVPKDLLLSPPPDAAPEEEYDPHIWFDPTLWAYVVDEVADQLAELDPAHAADYRRRGGEYRAEVLALRDEVRERLAPVPPRSRVLVTSHDAFRYFGRAFDVDVVAIQGISTQEEASTADLDRVADIVIDRGLRSVFVETSMSDRTVRAVLAAVRHRGGAVGLGSALYSDSTGADGTPEGTYLGMVRANAEGIAEGLR